MTNAPPHTAQLEHAWKRVEVTASPEPAVYLDTVTATEFAQTYKKQTYGYLEIGPGSSVLDVGCGTGDDVLALARLIAPGGKAVGVDKNPGIIAEAWRRAAGAGLPVQFQVADSHCLAFEDASFDACRADRAVQHMKDPPQVIAEMARVVRPGGRVAVSEPDWETLVIDSRHRGVTRRIVNFMCDKAVEHGWIGRQLPAIFQRAGLKELTVSASTMILTGFVAADRIWGLQRHAARARDAGAISTSEMEAWALDLKEADSAGRFFSAAVGFLAAGRKA